MEVELPGVINRYDCNIYRNADLFQTEKMAVDWNEILTDPVPGELPAIFSLLQLLTSVMSTLNCRI